ncbi:MAG TPA: DUF2336 domain-containing protein [Rhizomicrobium sp.]|jgi:uncharacterized protein (DUF2336 family)|nr:DUF2336 domain-containing protein [Rhizomicrobium sp.]
MQKALSGATSQKAEGERLDPRAALKILEDRARGHDDAAIRDADLGEALFEYLAEYGAAATRQAVAANKAVPAYVNRTLANDTVEAVRAELAVKIARLMPGLEQRESEDVVALTIATLEVLAKDSAVKVRSILAEEIKRMDCIPHDIALRLAHDLEVIVAAPILEYSPLLSDVDLVEVIAAGKVQKVLTAIARRKPLSDKVSDALVQSLDVSTVASLLVNQDAKIRKETMDRIVEEAEQFESWHEPLVMRADLSARVIRRIANFVGSALLELLSKRDDLSPETQAQLARRLKVRLEQNEPPKAQLEGAAQAVAKAKEGRSLDDAFVENAALAGRRETVILALAELSRVPESTVRKIMDQHSAKPLVALVWHAHLSMRTAFRIQTSVMKLPGHELLPARGGVNFPLSKEEMRWHLSYFDVAA